MTQPEYVYLCFFDKTSQMTLVDFPLSIFNKNSHGQRKYFKTIFLKLVPQF